jgi:uncharacterized membrane protein
MAKSLPVLFRSALYAFRGGFLIRPFVIALTLGAAGAVLSSLEEQTPAIGSFVPEMLFPSHADPQVAQAILTDIATSIMTVVAIVFAILLMTLTLASTQFSPRILISFIRDRVTQWTLGVFLGTFCYCIAALPAARSLPYPFVPVATVMGAMLLAPVCVGWLIYFIHHISNAISVNHIVDRIRRETELVIDEVMPDQRRPLQLDEAVGTFPEKLEFLIASRQSGYIRVVDIERLRSLANAYRVCLRLERRVGHFVPEGVTLMKVSRGDRITEERALQLLAAIDIGPTRTMQQDVEFGIVQIVDIALRAISPAVNDPTTLAPFMTLGRWGLSVQRNRHIAWIFSSGAAVLRRRRNDRISSSTSSSAICDETISCAWKLYGLYRVLRPSYKALFMDENSIKASLDGENSIARRVQTTHLDVASEMI